VASSLESTCRFCTSAVARAFDDRRKEMCWNAKHCRHWVSNRNQRWKARRTVCVPPALARDGWKTNAVATRITQYLFSPKAHCVVEELFFGDNGDRSTSVLSKSIQTDGLLWVFQNKSALSKAYVVWFCRTSSDQLLLIDLTPATSSVIMMWGRETSRNKLHY